MLHNGTGRNSSVILAVHLWAMCRHLPLCLGKIWFTSMQSPAGNSSLRIYVRKVMPRQAPRCNERLGTGFEQVVFLQSSCGPVVCTHTTRAVTSVHGQVTVWIHEAVS